MKKTIQLRLQWFQLKAFEFIKRYAAGMVIVLLFLPGVAIGDNLSLLFYALIQPFLFVISYETPFFSQSLWLLLLFIIFVVWVVAQKQAINGGPFAKYSRCLPVSSKSVMITDFSMILLANHILWLVILFGYHHLMKEHPNNGILIFKYNFLLSLLFVVQYVVIFSSKEKRLYSLSMLLALSLALMSKTPMEYEWMKVIALYVSLFLVLGFLESRITSKSFKTTYKKRFRGVLKPNIYLQMMFQSALPGTIFRVSFSWFLFAGLIMTHSHFTQLNDYWLTIHFFITEALLAFYLSGFYLLFRDERLVMSDTLKSLPIPAAYWFVRDIIVMMTLSFVVHLPYYFWLNSFSGIFIVLKSWMYHLFLLVLCYPLRIRSKDQTFTPFVILLLLTILMIFLAT